MSALTLVYPDGQHSKVPSNVDRLQLGVRRQTGAIGPVVGANDTRTTPCCELRQTGSTWEVTRLSSHTPPVMLNGSQLRAEAPHTISDGDKLKVNGQEVKLKLV